MSNIHSLPASRLAIYCSFCGKSQTEVRRLVAGARTYICDQCVAMCVGVLNVEEEKAGEKGAVSETRMQIEHLRTLMMQITHGRWETRGMGVHSQTGQICHYGISNGLGPPRVDETAANAQFASAARNAIPGMIALIDHLTARVADAETTQP